MDSVYFNPNNNNGKDMESGSESIYDDSGVEDSVVTYGNLTLLADADTPIIVKADYEDPSTDDNTVDKDRNARRSLSGKYKMYDEGDVRRFINIMEEQRPAITEAARECNIPRSSAYKLISKWNAGDRSVLPGVRKPTE